MGILVFVFSTFVRVLKFHGGRAFLFSEFVINVKFYFAEMKEYYLFLLFWNL